MENLVTYMPVIGIVGVIFAVILYWRIVKAPTGTSLMKDISDQIHDGAMAFLRTEYSMLVLFVVVVAVLLAWQLHWKTSVAFIGGAT